MKTKKRFHKLTAWLLTLAMLMTLMPMSAFAVEMSPHSHPICGAAHTNIGDHTGNCTAVEWLPLSNLLGEPDEDGKYSGATITQSGKYYLDTDITFKDSDALTIQADVSLCLNGNTLTYGGRDEAITVDYGATLNICDCSIGESGTITTLEFAANTIDFEYGTVNLYSGTIVSKGSCAIYLYRTDGESTFNQYGGTVQANGTSSAVEVYNGSVSGTYNLYGGTVEATPDEWGSVISISGAQATLSMSGAPTITNASTSEYSHDIYIETPINIADELTADAPQYSVMYPGGGIFTSGWDTHMANADYGDYFVSAYPDFVVLKDTSGELKLAEPAPEARWGASADSLTESGTLADAVAEAATDSSIAYIQLQSGVTLGETLNITGGNFTLDLNGQTVSGTASHLFDIEGGTVTIDDTSENGKISGASGSTVVYISGGTLNLKGGRLESISAESNANALYISGSATVNISGGEVYAENTNTNSPYPEAVSINSTNSSLTVSGGSIAVKAPNAQSSHAFGIRAYQARTLSITGGSISATVEGRANNSWATGIYVGYDNAIENFMFSDGSISASGGERTGGIAFYGDQALTISGGLITLSNAGSYKGAVYSWNKSPVITVVNNAAFSDSDNFTDFYIYGGYGVKVNLSYTTSPSTAPTTPYKIYISPTAERDFTSGWSSLNVADTEIDNYFTAPGSNQKIIKNTTTNELRLVEAYTITFSTGGYGTAPDSQKLLSGEKVTKPEDPVREGYGLNHWCTNSSSCTNGTTCENAWDFDNDTVTASDTLYAAWERTHWEVYLNLQGGDCDIDYAYADKLTGKLASLPEATRVGYIFNGWFSAREGGNEITTETEFSSNTTIYAQWTAYAITQQPTVDNEYEVIVNPSADVTYTWHEITETTVTTENADVYEDDGYFSSYTDGWWSYHSTEGMGTPGYFRIDLNAGDTVEVELSRNCEGTVRIQYFNEETYDRYQAYENTNGGNKASLVAPAAAKYDLYVSVWDGSEQPTVKAKVINAGEAISGQITNKLTDGTGGTKYVAKITYPDGTVLTSEAVAYIVPTYTVSFNANGGTSVDEQTVENGGMITQPTAPTKTGYTFGGWYKEAALTNEWNFASDTVTAETTLYAKWTANTNTPYVVNYWVQTLDAAKAGNAEKNDTNYIQEDTETYYGTSDASVWAPRINIEGFTTPDGKMITISPDGTTEYDYYYVRNKYNIHINDVDGVSSVSGAGDYFFGETVTISATVEPGYKWIGWAGSLTTTEQTHTFTMGASNGMVLTPQLVAKAPVVIDETTQFADYDGTPKAFRIISEDNLEGFTITYEQNGQDVTPQNAGFYDVVLSREEDDTYKAYSETLVNGLIINKVVVDEPEVGTKLYSGSLQTANITGTDIYEVTENNGGTNVGEYDVILTLKDTTNYKWKLAENSGATATRKFYITFTENAWDAEPQITGWTYGQSANAPTFDAKFGEVVVEYKKTSEDETAYTTDAPVNAGNYNVKFTVSATTNFSGLSKVINLNIAKATPSLEAPTAQNSITYGAKLNTVGLPTGWSWLDGDTIPTVKNNGYTAYYTPADTDNYDWTTINGWNETEARVERTVAVTVTKNNPSYTAPTGLTATYGQTLADVQLTEGWNWKAPTTSVGNAGTNTFAAVFTPVDTDNYNTVEVDLTITVARQKVAKPAENVTVFTYNSNEQIYTLTEDARYEITNNKRTDAGNQTVTIALKDSANYEWADGSVDDVEYTFTIAKATADIAVDTAPIVKTYGEALTLPTATSTFGIPVCDKTVAQLSDVGSYEVTYSVAETSNYYGDTKTLSVTINPAIISKPTADNTEFVYNGSMQTYSVSSNSNYTVSGNTRTDAGEQTVTVTLTDKHNYRWDDNSTDDVTFTFTIAQKEIGIEWGTTQFTYNKTEQKPTATATGLAAGDSCTITVTGGQTNTGNGYVATAQSPSNVNYKLPAIKTTTFSIAQKSVTVTGVTIEATKVYDGEANAPITNYGTVSNVIDGDDVTVDTANASAAYNDKNVGNGKSVTFTGFAITGTDATNYVLTGQPESQSANITPKPVTITGVTVAVTKIYDANVTASIENTGSVDGVISGDAVDVNSSSVTAVYDDANVGTDKAVTFAGFAISGADALNYELSAQPASTTANIMAKDIANAVITLGESLTYNGNEQPQTIASAIVDGLTITYDVSGNVNTDAGDYTLTITGNGNFEGTAQKAYTIAKADATLGTAPSAITPLTYNAAEQTLVNTGENVVGGTLMYKLSEGEYSAELPKATNAGTYTVYYKVMGDSNHNHTAEQNFTVTIAEKVVSPVVVLTAPASNQTPVTSIETDEYTATVTWSPDVTDKFAYSTDYTATVTITPKANYTLTGIRENEYTIEGAAVTNSADSSVVTAVFPKTNSRPSGGSSVTRYTVKFDTDGGSSVSSATVTKNAKVTEPKAPEKEGYTFMGWYTDEALTEAYDFDSKVTKNLTLYAKWDKHDDEQPGTDTHNCPSKAFDDLDITKWYHLDTDYVIENGIFKGTTETTFEPDSAQTRAMMVTVLYRVEGEPAVNKSIPFADVDMGAYYANAVIWGQQNGIIKGYSETEFGPDDKITREQIAAIMHRYAQYKGYDVSVGENTNILSYDDFDSISEYAIASMQYACGSGLMKGKTTSTLNPLDNATRAEIAAILHRFIEANK